MQDDMVWDRKIDTAVIEVATLVAIIGILTGRVQLLIVTALLISADLILQVRRSVKARRGQ